MPGLPVGHLAPVAGPGIGRAIGTGCAAEGARIVRVDRNLDGAAETAAAVRPAGGKAAACPASKHGGLVLPQALAVELGSLGIQVNAIGPGPMETPLDPEVRARDLTRVRDDSARTPLGRPGRMVEAGGQPCLWPWTRRAG